MRIHAVKIMSVAAIAAVAVLGTVYANAGPSHTAVSSKAAVTSTSKSANGGTLKAHPFASVPKKNIAHTYTTSTTGGTGQLIFNLPNPGKGVYAASFTANFFPEGTPGAPETFSCYITKDGSMLTQATASSTYTSGFYVGVNGGNIVQLTGSTALSVGCGVADGTAWTWGTKPLEASLTRLDGITSGSLAGTAQKSGSASTSG